MRGVLLMVIFEALVSQPLHPQSPHNYFPKNNRPDWPLFTQVRKKEMSRVICPSFGMTLVCGPEVATI